MTFWFILRLKITVLLAFICFHLLHHSLSFTVINCHLLSLTFTRCHLFSLVVSLVVTSCTILCHSLSLIVPLVYLFINNMPLFFSSKWATSFYIKRRYSVLHDIFKKCSHLTVKLTSKKLIMKKMKKYFHDRDTKYFMEKHVINFLIYILFTLLNIHNIRYILYKKMNKTL